ncbi:hypothetical protein ABEB36_005608 [Hypothenemus hampei]|uniref:Uncharacterized protein n=1 Tax=Hypothenemus hampei TaxID=57062 RepID=A0ABD1EZG3_HYPHA
MALLASWLTGRHLWKSVTTLIFLVIFTLAYSTSPPHPCQCWPDWQPIKDEHEYYCKDTKSEKTFHCNIDLPPICKCKENGQIINRPLGEVNCVEIGRTFDNINCEPDSQWKTWFDKYPQYRLYH